MLYFQIKLYNFDLILKLNNNLYPTQVWHTHKGLHEGATIDFYWKKGDRKEFWKCNTIEKKIQGDFFLYRIYKKSNT